MRVKGRRRRLVPTVTVMAALVLSGGCSRMMSQPPPQRPLRYEGECETSRLPVAGDVYLSVNTGAVALLGVLAAAFAAGNASNETVPSWDPHPRSTENMPVYLALGALGSAATYGLIRSAAYGLRSARACDAAIAELQRARAGWISPYGGYWPAQPAPQGAPGVPPPMLAPPSPPRFAPPAGPAPAP